MNATELHNLAVRFRVGCPNLCHCETRDFIASIGGEIAIRYGFWLGVPRRNRKKRYAVALAIADLLDKKANQ